MKGYYIEITNNLLDPKHYKAMKESVWLFMWLIDKMTSVSEEGVGTILGGKAIKYEEIEKELGISRRTYGYWVANLEENGYISTKRTANGLTFYIVKAKKRFGRRCAENCTTVGNSDVQKMSSDVQRTLQGCAINVASLHIDNTIHNKDITKYPFLKEKAFSEIFNDFRVMRKGIKKPLTARAEEIILGKLHKHDIRVAVKMLENSVEHSWQSVFPLKPEEMPILSVPIYKSAKKMEITEEQRRANIARLAEMKKSLNLGTKLIYAAKE